MQLSFPKIELPADREQLVRWLSSETWPFHISEQLSREVVLGWIQDGIFTGTDRQTFWIVADSNQRVGLIRLFDLDDIEDGYPFFDLRIKAAYREQGIGQQALQWLTRYLFETWPQLKRIAGTTREDNLSMRHVFRKCGYVKEGHFRKDWPTAEGQRYDTIQYAILREDWVNQTVTPVNWNDDGDLLWKIRPYRQEDEVQWLRCRLLAFLDTAYFDNVLRAKERYANPAIELVAELDRKIVGLIDIECEEEPGTVCSPSSDPAITGKAGMIWHIAVHPDFRRRGIGRALLQAAVSIAKQSRIQRLEAWTRDDVPTQQWYDAQGFQKVETYFHVYVQDDEVEGCMSSHVPGLKPRSVFAHYQGENTRHIERQFRRVHSCNRYDLSLI